MKTIQKPRISADIQPVQTIEKAMTEDDLIENVLIENEFISEVKPERIHINGSIFRSCDFMDCRFDHCDFCDCIFDNCDLSNLSFEKGSFHRCEFHKCRCTGSEFTSMLIQNTVFDHCK